MNPRNNLLSLLKRQGYEWVPVDFSFCPAQIEQYRQKTGSTLDYEDYFELPWRNVPDIKMSWDPEVYRSWHGSLKEGAVIDQWGVAHEPGSKEAKHMTYMRNPLRDIAELERIREYPFLDFSRGSREHQSGLVDALHSRGLAAVGNMQCTIWELSWYLRGMEDLMVDMMNDDPIAAYILDVVTEQSLFRAKAYAEAGADIIYLGDDIGTQRGPMMSLELYRKWIKPRLKEVISGIRAVNPEIVVIYHSCGMVTPFIDDLIDAGIDVLNPLQTECMDYKEIVSRYGGKLSFHGGIGTQSVMPFGTPEDVRRAVRDCLDAAGPKGGFFAAPTHLLEPEVPWENITAYVEACKNYC